MPHILTSITCAFFFISPPTFVCNENISWHEAETENKEKFLWKSFAFYFSARLVTERKKESNEKERKVENRGRKYFFNQFAPC